MRLQATVQRSHGLSAKLKLAVGAVATGGEVPDIILLLLYRPALFGRPFTEFVDAVMRTPDSAWSVGERELFATYVSQLNRCAFCFNSHRAMAVRKMGEDVVEAALTDPDTAPVREETRAALHYLRVLAKYPGDLDRSHSDKALAVLGRAALIEVAAICTLFMTINTIADSLGFRVPSAVVLERTATMLLRHGYKV